MLYQDDQMDDTGNEGSEIMELHFLEMCLKEARQDRRRRCGAERWRGLGSQRASHGFIKHIEECLERGFGGLESRRGIYRERGATEKF